MPVVTVLGHVFLRGFLRVELSSRASPGYTAGESCPGYTAGRSCQAHCRRELPWMQYRQDLSWTHCRRELRWTHCRWEQHSMLSCTASTPPHTPGTAAGCLLWPYLFTPLSAEISPTETCLCLINPFTTLTIHNGDPLTGNPTFL